MKATFFQLCHPHPSDRLAYPAVKTDPLCPCHAVWHDSHLLSIWFWSSASSYLTSHQMVVSLWVTLRGPTERMVGNEYWTCCAVNGMGQSVIICSIIFWHLPKASALDWTGLDWWSRCISKVALSPNAGKCIGFFLFIYPRAVRRREKWKSQFPWQRASNKDKIILWLVTSESSPQVN